MGEFKSLEELELECRNVVGNLYGEMFSTDIYQDMCKQNLTEYEKYFYIAFKTVCEIESQKPLYFQDKAKNTSWLYSGIDIVPKARVGEVTVDFLISIRSDVNQNFPPYKYKHFIINCNSLNSAKITKSLQEWRFGRYIKSQGYKILTYSKEEVFDNPIMVAVDVYSKVTGRINPEEIIGAMVMFGSRADNEDDE